MKIKNLLFTALTISAFTSCQKDPSEPAAKGNFIVAVTPVAATGVADYLLTTSSLDTGKVSTQGRGVEQDGTYRYYLTHRNKFFSMLYGQGNPGAVTVYNILDGSLNKLANSVTETVQAFAPVNNDILLMKISRNVTNPVTNWYRFDTDSLKITKQGNLNTADILKNGELAFFSWIKQVGSKVYAPFFSVKGCCSMTFGTDYPDQAWVAVYSYPEMQLEKVIKDSRTSFIGRYFTDGLELVENGDVYAYSSSIATSNGTNATMNSSKPSAVTRIKAGTTEFDQSFYINFEEISSGLNITNWLYVGQNKFITFSNTKENKGAYNVGNIIGVLDVSAKTWKAVTGLPKLDDIKGFTSNNFSDRGGSFGYIGLNLTSGIGYVYKIDANTASATRGLKIEGGTLTAIEHLN